MTLPLRGLRADVPGDRVHQMGLAEPDPAVKEERVERHRPISAGAGLRDTPGGGMGKLVGLADDEVLEREALIERRLLRPVLADLECGRTFACKRNRMERHPCRRLAGRVIDRRRRLGSRGEDDREALDLGIFRPPQRQQPVRVMRRHPIAQEARRRDDYRLPVTAPVNAERAQPAAQGGLPDLVPEAAQNPSPFGLARRRRAIDVNFSNCFRHHRIPQI